MLTEEMTIEELCQIHWATAQEIDRRGGRMDSYAAPHVWALVAKQIREEYAKAEYRAIDDGDQIAKMAHRRALEDLAIAFAKRFNQDAGFDPLAWLDKCSPDPVLYPFSELWEEDEA